MAGFVIHTPWSASRHFEIYLSWDPLSCVTSGYLNGGSNSNRHFLSEVRQLGSPLRLPMAPIFLILHDWIGIWVDSYNDALRTVNEVQYDRGLLKSRTAQHNSRLQSDYKEVHRLLTQAYERCTLIEFGFVSELSDALASTINALPQWIEMSGSILLQADLEKGKIHADQLGARLKPQKCAAEVMLGRIDLSIRVVSVSF